jgi:hypothetical protein
VDWRNLPEAARLEVRADRRGHPNHDAGPAAVIEAGVGWLGRAQDRSSTHDGGVARHYSLTSGWGPSYPEVTGYIIPTMIDAARAGVAGASLDRPRRMLDWLVAIQMADGGFQGGTIRSTPVVPVTFNTGQILIGLAAGVAQFGECYRTPMQRAGDWLVSSQDPDGCWRRFPTPFAQPGEKVYETHVSWGLVEAHRLAPERGYAAAALANARWAISRQRSNGWFAACCLSQPDRPLTHTIAYTLRGLIEVYRVTGAPELLTASERCADALAACCRDDGFIPGRLDAQWNGRVSWVCLTGSSQIVACWYLLDALRGQQRFGEAAGRVNAYVRRTVRVDGEPDVRGAVKGSFPVSGSYGAYEYPSWAAKFTVDANVMELGGWQALGAR